MPNQHSVHHPLRHQNQSKNLLWATCSSCSTWPHPSQQVSFAGLACFTGPRLAGPQTGLCLVTGWKGRHREALAGSMIFLGAPREAELLGAGQGLGVHLEHVPWGRS